MPESDPAFEFFTDELPGDGELMLCLSEQFPASENPFGVPMYRFAMRHREKGQTIGRIQLRVGWNEHSIRYAGQIGYTVEPEFRGHHFAERACRLLIPLLRRHGLNSVWITSNPDNIASRRTLDRLGANLVEIVRVPDDYPMTAGALRQKACYRWTIAPPSLGFNRSEKVF